MNKTGTDAPTPDRSRQRLFVVGWLGALALTAWALIRLGRTDLGAPPLLSPNSLSGWADDVGTANAAFAFVRLAALALTSYLLVMTVVGLAARATKRRDLIALADLVTIPLLRRLLSGAAGLGMTVTALSLPVVPVVASLAADQRASTRSLATAAELFDHPDGPLVGLAPVDVQDREDPPTEQPHGDGGPGRAGVDEPIVDLRDPADRQRPVDDDPVEADLLGGRDVAPTMRAVDADDQTPDHAWTAEAGDHLWTIAARTLDDAWGRPASDAEIAPYWIDIIARNQVELADPENPDLVFPGQVFHLPTPPAEPD